MTSKDFLFEIGTEELPAKQLLPLKQAFYEQMKALLEKNNLSFQEDIQVFITPRRLAVLVPGLVAAQPDQLIEKKGPALSAAFGADGKPTKACEGFAKSMGLTVEELERRETPQGIWLYAAKLAKGQATEQLLPEIIYTALTKLPIAKPMHWGNHTEAFLRPIRWVLMVFGNQVIPASFFGILASNKTYGHRFLAPQAMLIDDPRRYKEQLYHVGKVVADFDQRQSIIREELIVAAKEVLGTIKENPELLEEVTGLVEWPVVLRASFADRFLAVPANALVSSMEGHQKCFAILDANQQLLPYFLTVSNLVSNNPEQVVLGNERVMQARLSDAEFFFYQDAKLPLQDHLTALDKVVFQVQLGSMAVKSRALSELAGYLAEKLCASIVESKQAGLLAKCDLRTQMVGEFPELQGEMGQIYALKQGVDPKIAHALFEQYLPRFAGDQLPNSSEGIVLALADRLLNLVGIIGVGQIPTGDKDPFALRRAALGVIRIIIERQLDLNLRTVLIQAQTIWQQFSVTFSESDVVNVVFDFIIERLRYWYLEQGISPQVLQAVLALDLDNLTDINARIKALAIFQQMPEATALAAANKRVNNLFQKEQLDASNLGQPDFDRFTEAAEKHLADALVVLQAGIKPLIDHKQYAEALQQLAGIRAVVDDFFNEVMVLVDDVKIRHNRLSLLAQLKALLSAVADISLL